MPLETATYIPDLNAANPAHTDQLAQADSHMRLIKAVLKATFPNFTSVALASTQAQIDAAVVAALATIARSGTVPPGAVTDFAMAAAPVGWVACDGQSLATATYPDLFAAIGYVWGGTGANFNVPNLTTLSRFRRHRGTLAGAVGNLQATSNLAHTHNSGTITTSNESTNHTHNITPAGTVSVAAVGGANVLYGGTGAQFIQTSGSGGGGYGYISVPTYGAMPITISSATFSGANANTGIQSAVHTHNFSFVTSGGSADDASESRPNSATFLTCIKL